MIQIKKSSERGISRLEWLDSKHSFSFGDYYDPNNMGFNNLKVINEDIVAPDSGFATHQHSNMEIISYVIKGELSHKDSMGNGSIIKKGDVQRMSAGKCVSHSEYNNSKEKEVHFLQIWFLPDKKNIEPSYEQKNFPDQSKQGQFQLVASQKGNHGSLKINQDVNIYIALLNENDDIKYSLTPGRAAWVQIVRGELNINNNHLKEGDGAAITNETDLLFTQAINSEILVFDMKDINNH